MSGELQGSQLADQTIAYSSSASPVTKATGFADFFTNTHTALCGVITECSLKTPSGCAGPYAGNNLVIDTTTGAITGLQNIDAGYVEPVCV
jgi:hypothetical protein